MFNSQETGTAGKGLRRYLFALAAVTAVVLFVRTGIFGVAARSEEGKVLPAPAIDEQAGPPGSAVAVVAGGCFWGVQGVFQHVKGVTNAVSGYAGGSESSAHYEMVSFGGTGHAEAVEVTYDPRQITYGRLLQVYFSVAHDPTQLNYQGPDVGTQYRSAIFPSSDDQARIAKAYIAQLDAARVFETPIVTKIEPGHEFYPAEPYHQDYLTRNPDAPYIVFNDLPKIAGLKRLFAGLYREEPILVGKK